MRAPSLTTDRSSAEIADYLLLQAINRAEALLATSASQESSTPRTQSDPKHSSLTFESRGSSRGTGICSAPTA